MHEAKGTIKPGLRHTLCTKTKTNCSLSLSLSHSLLFIINSCLVNKKRTMFSSFICDFIQLNVLHAIPK